MTELVLTYAKNRLGPVKFGGMLLLNFICLFKYREVDLPAAALLIFSLVTLRLYDDLMRGKTDGLQGPNADPQKSCSSLWMLDFVLMSSCCLLSPAVARYGALLCAGFFFSNHLFYLLFRHTEQLKYFLPFLKYPFLSALLLHGTGHSFIAGVLLFLFMLSFDALEDSSFPGKRVAEVVLPLSTLFLIMFLIYPSGAVILAPALLAACIFLFREQKWFAYFLTAALVVIYLVLI